MDVTFTNVLEGARQYFQGLPAGTGSTASPAYSVGHPRNDSEQHAEMPPSSSAYWPMAHQDPSRMPSREHTPIQRPPTEQTPIQRPSSHHSEGSRPPSHHSDSVRPPSHHSDSLRPPSHHSDSLRPPSHHSQYMPSVPNEQNRSQGISQYQGSYQEQSSSMQQQQQQSFHFSRPHSREAPANIPHQQQQYQPHIQRTSPFHPPSPQHRLQPRSQEQHVVHQPSSQTYHQLQTMTQSSQAYTNYQQSHHYYPTPQSQSKPVATTSNNLYKPSSVQSYTATSQQNAYYKHAYTSQTHSSHIQYVNSKPTHSMQPQDSRSNVVNTGVVPNESTSQAYRTTHNLPPIASLSVNYHSTRSNREPARQSNVASRVRAMSSSLTSSTNPQNHQATSGTSIIHSNPSAKTVSHSSASYQRPESDRNNLSYTSQANQSYAYSTSTTQAYNRVIMTTSSTSSVYSAPLQSQSSIIQQYYQTTKSNNQVTQLSQPTVNVPINHQNHTSQSMAQTVADRSINSRVAPAVTAKQKRESPLDLSVKTVRTPADSTLDDVENERNKYYNANRTSSQSSISTHNYPTYDVNSFQRNLTQRSSQLQSTTTAPKVEFHPNFNATSLNQPRNFPLETHRNLPAPEKINNNSRLAHENIMQYQPSVNSNRYPTVSVPTAVHVNSYINSHQPPKRTSEITSSYYAAPSNEKKRPALDIPPTAVPNKIPKVDSWKQTIDQQIELRFSNYKEQQHKLSTAKTPVVNGTYSSALNFDKSKEFYGSHNKQPSHPSVSQSFSKSSHYHSHSLPTQTYVPSPAPQYPVYSGVPTQQQHHQQSYNYQPPRTSAPIPTVANNKTNLGGADKRVLSLLRNSLEIKGAKEAQKKLDQLKSYEMQHPRSDVQHPSTDVTAPIQPKAGVTGRNNVSPFTPTSFLEGQNNMTSIYKFHVPKAIDSVNYETNNSKPSLPIIGKDMVNEGQTIISNHTSVSSEFDGLAAAFLAARIRTKGELKQVGPAQNVIINAQTIIENQLKSPLRQDTSQSSAYCSTSSGSSPPKLPKEKNVYPPRRRLFSRTEEDIGNNNNNNNVPPRDKSGLRSSSETSVFDFPDSDSENEMPVLERQSLEALRRQKSSMKHTTTQKILKIESPGPPSPFDDIFDQACSNFVEQLKCGLAKKKAKRKKGFEPDVLANLETVTKEKPLESNVDIKIGNGDALIENKDTVIKTNDKLPDAVTVKIKEEQLTEDIPSTTTQSSLLSVQKEINNMPVKHYESSGESCDSEPIPVVEVKPETKDILLEKSDVIKEPDMPKKFPNPVPFPPRPAKKPPFGDGTDFYPGWEEGVYKYKKSLRMPQRLIQVTRPPQFYRLSTSLPDLDPCPNSPTPSVATDSTECTSKDKPQKLKFDSFDSDTESNCSFNLFSKNNNYDSEGSSSIKSLPNTNKEGQSILDRLLERYGAKKRKKHKKKDGGSPKIVPKAEDPLELLATPSLEIPTKEPEKELKKLASPVITSESSLLGFRKKTVHNFKDAFMKSSKSLVGINEQFATVILKSRTRTETRVLKQRATIKEVFGEDRPASAPPVTCMNETKVDEEVPDENQIPKEEPVEPSETPSTDLTHMKEMLKSKILNRGIKRNDNNLLKTLVEKKIKTEVTEQIEEVPDEVEIKRDPDAKSETFSIDGDETIGVPGKKKNKFRNMRRKFSSGFDYIRKKKKQVKKENLENDAVPKQRKRGPLPKASPESVQDIQKEIKSWVLNKGIGETHLHRAARLGCTDVTAYCLEKMDCNPSPKDNAGYTPLHEACARGHLDIAKLLLQYGANVSESAKGGVRPLHEAVENGFVEVVRLLLSYGADPMLATYAGSTPLMLATEERTIQLLNSHISDTQGLPSQPWSFQGPASCLDSLEMGYNVLDDIPDPDPISEEEDMEFEMSETLLPNLYTLRGEALNDRWMLLQDLSSMLKIKSRDALLRQICPPTGSSVPVNYKTVIRELKMSDFLEQSHCCQFLNAGEKINTRASKIALVKYTDKVRELLNVEKVLIKVR